MEHTTPASSGRGSCAWAARRIGTSQAGGPAGRANGPTKRSPVARGPSPAAASTGLQPQQGGLFLPDSQPDRRLGLRPLLVGRAVRERAPRGIALDIIGRMNAQHLKAMLFGGGAAPGRPSGRAEGAHAGRGRPGGRPRRGWAV